jgi:isoleucyl-tRNA synthetase
LIRNITQLNTSTIYEKWEKSGFFNPDKLNLPENAPSYTIVLPPPNITAKLHLGHASAMLAIEDLLIRYKRLKWFSRSLGARNRSCGHCYPKCSRKKNFTRTRA